LGSLVHELQMAASEPGLPVADLLRKALVVARRLKIREAATWIEAELEGYPNAEDLPDHRKVRGMCGFSNDDGTVSCVSFPTTELELKWNYRYLGGTIAQIEADSHMLTAKIPYSAPDSQNLKTTLNRPFAPMLNVTRGAILGLLDSVRTAVLKWALQLEDEGILGEDMTFNPEEERKAAAADNSIIIHAVTASGIQIMQGSSQSIQEHVSGLDVAQLGELVKALRSAAADSNVPEAGRQTLNVEIAKIEVEIKKGTPDQGVIGKALKTIRPVLEQAVGSLIAAGILHMYPHAFGLPG
jgi:hypothetical protein